MNEIDVSGLMARAFHGDEVTYQPVLQGVKLEAECRCPAATLRNLKEIVAAGNPEIAAFILGKGRVLVVFPNGFEYFATGFEYGHMGDQVREFAFFAAKHGFGDGEELFAKLSTMRRDDLDFIPRVMAEDVLAQDSETLLSAHPRLW